MTTGPMRPANELDNIIVIITADSPEIATVTLAPNWLLFTTKMAPIMDSPVAIWLLNGSFASRLCPFHCKKKNQWRDLVTQSGYKSFHPEYSGQNGQKLAENERF